jgi:hypothetical protein
VGPKELSSRAIFALSRGFPTMGDPMLDQPAEGSIAAIYARKSAEQG